MWPLLLVPFTIYNSIKMARSIHKDIENNMHDDLSSYVDKMSIFAHIQVAQVIFESFERAGQLFKMETKYITGILGIG
jgi:hypothetical protein